jgi:hypothetical protein
MTEEAWRTLVDELGQLRIDVAVLSGTGAPDPSAIHLPAFKAARRLDVLSPGDTVEVDAPVGRRVVTVLSVE